MPKFDKTLTVVLTTGSKLTIEHDDSLTDTYNMTDPQIRANAKTMVEGGLAAIWSVIDALTRYPAVNRAELDKLHHLGRVCFLLSMSRVKDADYLKQRRSYASPPTTGETQAQFLKETLGKIRTNFARTLTGITGDLTVRIGTLDGASTVGSVKYTDLVKNKGPAERPKGYNVTKDLDTGHHAVWKHISIDSCLLGDPTDAVNTFVHEATHKHVGTDDRFYIKYWDKRDDRKKTYFNESKVTAENALINADSYGHFAHRFWLMKTARVPDMEGVDLDTMPIGD